MQTEIEAKFLDINVNDTREKLKKIGAVLEYPERLMKRKVFDVTEEQVDSWEEITFIPVPDWLEIKRK